MNVQPETRTDTAPQALGEQSAGAPESMHASTPSDWSKEPPADSHADADIDTPNATATPRLEPVPEVQLDPPLHAARDASAYVARMFQDMCSDDASQAAAAVAVVAQGDSEVTAVGADETGKRAHALPLHSQAPELAVVTGVSPADVICQLMAGRTVLVLGLGVSGLSMARWCVRCGASVTVADTRAAPPLIHRLRSELPGVQFVGGALDAALLDERHVDAVYRSPGLSPLDIAAVVDAAAHRSIGIAGELGLYCDALDALRGCCGYEPRVLGITGTNGKTTVTALTGLLVERSGVSVAVAGNIGPALLDTLSAQIDNGTLPDVWVLELSSFQLDAPAAFAPTAATVLNLSQDHLDWHGDMASYAHAKSHVFGPTGLMVLNRDDAAVMAMHDAAGFAPVSVRAESDPAPRAKCVKPVPRACVTFGADMPNRPGDFGIETVNGMAWLVRAQEGDETRKRGARRIASAAAADPEALFVQRLMPADALRIRGRHNAVNALAALALAQAAGCALGPMLYGLREYRGEPHRVESIAVIDGVEFFDDSKGTNVGATVAAISGLGAERRVVVILGGLGKGQDFTPLAAPVARYARAVVLIGRDAAQIRAALEGAGVLLLAADSLDAAVAAAADRAHAGDAVLLSPACSSFDMFDSYVQRGEVFRGIVRSRAHAVGQAMEGEA